MNAKAHDLRELLSRLLRADLETKKVIRREVQAWSYEEIVETLRVYGSPEADVSEPPIASVAGRLRHLLAPAAPSRQNFVALDVFLQIIAETTNDVRLIGLVLFTLARYEEVKQAQRVSRQPRWGYGSSAFFVMIHIETVPGFYTDMQIPLLGALGRLLPQVTPGDCSLSSTQRDALLIPLKYPYRDVKLTIDTLAALSWLGEENCLATVARVQETSIDTDNGHKIRAAAQVCREQIRLRIDKKRQAQTLLRAAASPAPSDADSLLRGLPEAAPDPAPEQLVRPVE